MDFMLEEELLDLMTACLKEPDSAENGERHGRITEIGRQLFEDGGVDAMENFFFAVRNRIEGETGLDAAPMRRLWTQVTPEWKE